MLVWIEIDEITSKLCRDFMTVSLNFMAEGLLEK